jgi:hypothetical protein
VSGFMTKWLVALEYPVTEAELDADGAVSDATVERWVDAARTAYLEQCPRLHRLRAEVGLELRHDPRVRPPGALLGRPAGVFVTATATEVRPAEFTISVRLRPGGGEREAPVNASDVIRLARADGRAHELGTEVRDELIALEHSATHYN